MLNDFESDHKITEYELLTEFNPRYINSKIKAIHNQIECLYHLNTSHVEEVDGERLVSVSYPLENLVIYICESKERLESFKRKSSKKMSLLIKILKNYTSHEQKEVMTYLSTYGRYLNPLLIDRLKEDIYQAIHPKKIEHIETFMLESSQMMSEDVLFLKNNLSNKHEVLSI